MLGQRRRRWANIGQTLSRFVVFAGWPKVAGDAVAAATAAAEAAAAAAAVVSAAVVDAAAVAAAVVAAAATPASFPASSSDVPCGSIQSVMETRE